MEWRTAEEAPASNKKLQLTDRPLFVRLQVLLLPGLARCIQIFPLFHSRSTEAWQRSREADCSIMIMHETLVEDAAGVTEFGVVRW